MAKTVQIRNLPMKPLSGIAILNKDAEPYGWNNFNIPYFHFNVREDNGAFPFPCVPIYGMIPDRKPSQDERSTQRVLESLSGDNNEVVRVSLTAEVEMTEAEEFADAATNFKVLLKDWVATGRMRLVCEKVSRSPQRRKKRKT